MVRIPGSYNSKNNSQVRIIQRWDGQRPYINWILRDFRRYLIQKKIKPEKKKGTVVYSTNWDKICWVSEMDGVVSVKCTVHLNRVWRMQKMRREEQNSIIKSIEE